LSDPQKRARFDRGEIDASGAERPRQRYYRDFADAASNSYASDAGFADFGGMDDILSEMFGRQGRGNVRMRGPDAHHRPTLDFLDAINGGKQQLTLPDGSVLDVNIPPGNIKNASARSLIMAAKALSNSSEVRTVTGSSFIPNVCTAACNSASWAGWEALSGFQRKATREREGITSLRSCNRLPATSGPRMVFPVILPPGLLKLATSPAPTGSPTPIMTMGIVVVACLAASVGGVPNVAMRSTGRWTISAAAHASRSGRPPA